MKKMTVLVDVSVIVPHDWVAEVYFEAMNVPNAPWS